MDELGVAHVVHVATVDVKYAVGGGGDWSIERFAHGVNGRALGVATGPDGVVHVLYYESYVLERRGLMDLHYARRDRGEWTEERLGVLRNGDGEDAALAVDVEGVAQAVWLDGDEDLVRARRGPAGWIFEAVPLRAPGSVGFAIDGAGAAHLVTRSADDPSRVSYATDVTGAWVVEDVAVPFVREVAYPQAVAIDSDGGVHVAGNGGAYRSATWHAWRTPGVEAGGCAP